MWQAAFYYKENWSTEKLDKLVKATQQAALGELRSEPRQPSAQVQTSKDLLYHLLILRISAFLHW